MAFDRKTRVVKKVVSILTDPHPEFVSAVQYPANQTPFRVVKSSPEAVAAGADEVAMKAASTVCDIHQMVFSKGHPSFKTAEKVASYLDENGYENFQIVEEGNFFIVPGREEEDFEGDLENITVQKGLVMTTGRLRPARKSAAPDRVVKAAEAARTAAEASASGEQTTSRKSIYHVGRFAEVLESIGYMASGLSYEADYEEDNSPIPDKIKAWLATGAEIFKELAEEEVSEFVNYVKAQKAERGERAAKSAEQQQEQPVTQQTTAAKAETTPVAAPAKAPTAVKPNADPAASATGEIPVEEPTTESQGTGTTTAPAAAEGTATAVTPGTETTTEAAPAAEGAQKSAETAPAAAPPAGFSPEMFAALGDALGSAIGKHLEPIQTTLTSVQETLTKQGERVQSLEDSQRQSRKSVGEVTPDNAASGAQKSADQEEARKAQEFQERQARNRMGL